MSIYLAESIAACGEQHTVIVRRDGGFIYYCGHNGYYQLGTGRTTNASSFLYSSQNPPIIDVACGDRHTILVRRDGTVSGCGYNANGQMGMGHTSNLAVWTTLAITEVEKVYCGAAHTFFVKNDHTVWACGNSVYGQLGLGKTGNVTQPEKVAIDDVKTIACGDGHTLFLKNDGTVWGCGSNYYHQLGLADTGNKLLPVELPITNVVAIATRDNHSFCVKDDGTVWACGYNGLYQLGTGDTAVRDVFTPIAVENVKSVACGKDFTIFVKNNGMAWGCGYNRNYELGLNNNAAQTSPVPITTIDEVKAVYCGGYHTVWIKEDDTVWTCGYNTSGQLGLGHTNAVPVPTKTIAVMWIKSYLLRDGGRYKTFDAEGRLVALDKTEITAADFEEHGFVEADAAKMVTAWDDLGEEFDLLTYSKSAQTTTCVIRFVPDDNWLVQTKGDFHLDLYSNRRITFGYNGCTHCRVVFSVNEAKSWYSYRDGQWQQVILNQDNVAEYGMTFAEVNALSATQWAELLKTNTLRIAVLMKVTALTETAGLTSVAVSGNKQAYWEVTDAYTDTYTTYHTLALTIKQAGNYRVNYLTE